jgi:hypothetical protein
VSGPPIPTNVPACRQDITRLFPGWQATPLLEGVRRTVDFYRR